MTITEYRGVSNLVYAKITKDDASGYTCSEPKSLCGVAEISKTVNVSSETHYYDNSPAIVLTSKSEDTITINCSAIPLDALAEITGKQYNATNGFMMDGNELPDNYFAIGYKTKKTDGTEMYVWRYKGKFSEPDMTVATEDDGTTANGQTLEYTGIETMHDFKSSVQTSLGHLKGIVVDSSIADVTGFFETVKEPKDIVKKV